MSSRPNKRRANGWRRSQLIARHRAMGRDCQLCFRPIDYTLDSGPWRFVVDEITPVALGGDPLSWANTEPAHAWCNRVKGTHTRAWAIQRIAQLLDPGTPAADNTIPTFDTSEW